MSEQTNKKQLPGSTEISVTLTLEQWIKILYTIGVGSARLSSTEIEWKHIGNQPTQEEIKTIVENEIDSQIRNVFEESGVKQVPEEKIEYIECDCFTHLIKLRYDNEDKCAYLSIWSYGIGDNKPNWKHRLHHIWKIIRTGYPYDDSIVLGKEQMKKISVFFSDLQNE